VIPQAASSERAPGLTPFAVGLLLGCLSTLLAALLACARAGVPGPIAWLAVWGAASLWVAPLAGALRTTGFTPSLKVVGLGVLMATVPLMIFARLLKSATHHRPLGAATFALVAALVLLFTIAAASRLLSLAARHRLPKYVLFGVIGALVMLVMLPALEVAEVRSAFMDGALVIGALVVAAAVPAPPRLERIARWAGLLMYAMSVLLALLFARGALLADLVQRTPLLLGLLGALAG
jgi:putative flippase GtrA